MENVAPHWRKFLTNLGWYLATLTILLLLTTVLRAFPMMVILWFVGLGWGGILAYQFGQLFWDRDEVPISEDRLQAYLDQAHSYKTQIDNAVKETEGQAEQIHQERLTRQIEAWVEAITSLVERVNSLQQDQLIRQDLEQVPQAIADLEARLADETDPDIRRQLERTLANRKKQLAALQALQNTITRAEIQIENTLSMLGTIYSQILTGQSTDDVADYSRLSTEVDEEVRVLQDHLEALREVKLGHS